MNNDPRGSIWRLWDLHFHTPSSFDVKNVIDNPGIVQLLRDRNVSVVAVTDHHTMDVARIRELKDLADEEITILPGVEFRTELGGSEAVHFIALFPEDVELESLWTSLQGKLDLTPKEVQQKGDERIYVDLRDTAQIVHALDGLTMVHAGQKSNSVEEIANSTQFKQALKEDLLTESIDILEVGAIEEARAYEEIVFPDVGCRRPVVIGSDTHHRPEDAARALCWIKADPTFSGLKQIMTEPATRVFLGDMPPAERRVETNSTKYIDSVCIHRGSDSSLDEAWFDVDIPVNHGLVAIIGNKGSGKSALADTIGLLGATRNSHAFSFLNPQKFRNPKQNKARHFEAYLRWVSGDEEHTCLDDAVDESAPEKINYVPQSYLEQICNEVVDLKGSDFDQELKRVIFSHVEAAQRLECRSLDELLDFRTSEAYEAIELLKADLRDVNQRIADLEDILAPSYRETIEQALASKKAELAAHRKAKPEEVQKPSADPAVEKKTAEITALIEKQKESLAATEKELSSVSRDNAAQLKRLALAEKLLARIENFMKQLESFLDDCAACKELGIEVSDIVQVTIDPAKLRDIRDDARLLSTQLSEKLDEDTDGTPAYAKKIILEKVAELERQLDLPNRKYRGYLKALDEWRDAEAEIQGKPEEPETIAAYEASLKELSECPTRLAEARDERQDIVRQMYAKKADISQMFASLYGPVQRFIAGHDLASSGLRLKFNVSVVDTGFWDTFWNHVTQGRRGTYCGVEDGQKRLRQILNEASFDSAEACLSFLARIDESLRVDLRDESKASVPLGEQLRKGIEPAAFYDSLFSLDYLEPKYFLTWADKELAQLSPGERGTLLLVFYLLIDKSNVPLVIDQPEENLDNETVYDILVPCIKEVKNRRQVIIVTHNPNLAVVCDADQIICAEMDKTADNRITYESGAIECPRINRRIIDVLEGTRPAFENRDAKYDVVKLR